MNSLTCLNCSKVFIPKDVSARKFCSISCSTSFKNKSNRIKNYQKYLDSPNTCRYCNTILPYEQKNNKFCSRSCAAKITNTMPRKRGPLKKEKIIASSVKFLFCSKTQQWFSNRNSDGSYRRCSPYIKSEKEKYYNAARFKFNVYEFPKEFNLELISDHGWYCCPGKKRKHGKKNINGVSRDHIISVSFGYENNIDPKIISHPANCRIILHSENKRKSNLCEMSIEELELRIKLWNEKYGAL